VVVTSALRCCFTSLLLLCARLHRRFSPVSGEYLATSSFDGTVKVWCARDWSKVAEFQTHESKTTDFGACRVLPALVMPL
jgi:WD40 repeat protein